MLLVVQQLYNSCTTVVQQLHEYKYAYLMLYFLVDIQQSLRLDKPLLLIYLLDMYEEREHVEVVHSDSRRSALNRPPNMDKEKPVGMLILLTHELVRFCFVGVISQKSPENYLNWFFENNLDDN